MGTLITISDQNIYLTINIAHQIRFIIFQLEKKPVYLSIVGQGLQSWFWKLWEVQLARATMVVHLLPHLTLGPQIGKNS